MVRKICEEVIDSIFYDLSVWYTPIQVCDKYKLSISFIKKTIQWTIYWDKFRYRK